jgi:hypothetical protein
MPFVHMMMEFRDDETGIEPRARRCRRRPPGFGPTVGAVLDWASDQRHGAVTSVKRRCRVTCPRHLILEAVHFDCEFSASTVAASLGPATESLRLWCYALVSRTRQLYAHSMRGGATNLSVTTLLHLARS